MTDSLDSGRGEYCGTEGKPGGEDSPEGVEAVGDDGDDLELSRDGVLVEGIPDREGGGDEGSFSTS